MKIWPTFRRSLLVPVLMVLLGLGLATLLSSCDPAADAASIQSAQSPPPPTPTPGGGTGSTTPGGPTAACVNAAPDGNCSQQGFAVAIFSYVNVPDNAANEYAMEVWERAEGGNWNNSAKCNPINTTETEPGSTSINSVNVQSFITTAGHTCWYWGVKANGDTLNNGDYGRILSVFRNPSSSTAAQCQALANAVASTPWGTSNFAGDC
ncbi:MAG TPA: hypothetical protein VIA06_08080 [Candidatus Dormibacteraeota bacterium]|jgi:hypothetical protein|nr:hypothetical protein [Candidatus Dormibacteraeota bacterium]